MREIEIIYSLLNVVRNGEHNNDERISERLMRNFLHSHRGDSLRKYYNNGQTIDDEVFQLIKAKLIRLSSNEFMIELPHIVRFENNYGFYLEKNGTAIPIMTSQEYQLNRSNPFNGKFVSAKTSGNNLFVRLPQSLQGLDQLMETYGIIKGFMDSVFQQEVDNFNNNTNFPITIEVDLWACLVNPDDCPDYNWETDAFPFPAERLPELRQQILRNEFGIMTEMKRDEVQNARGDEIRYHDNSNVNNA